MPNDTINRSASNFADAIIDCNNWGKGVIQEQTATIDEVWIGNYVSDTGICFMITVSETSEKTEGRIR